jgi:hypothetical protein
VVFSQNTQRRVLGDDHPNTLATMNNLAETLRAQDNLSEAREMHDNVLESRRRILGENHPNTLTSMNNLAVVFSQKTTAALKHIIVHLPCL